MCADVLPECMPVLYSVYSAHWIGVTEECELPLGCWELNSSSLKDQPVLLIAELPSLQT